MLGVDAGTLVAHVAVNEAVAAAIWPALRHSHADWALSITGIAGPAGGSPEKPVGTVCFSWAGPDGRVDSETRHFTGDREQVRRQSVRLALEGILERAASLSA
jgi:nicotinamide-nucleotide amidase